MLHNAVGVMGRPILSLFGRFKIQDALNVIQSISEGKDGRLRVRLCESHRGSTVLRRVFGKWLEEDIRVTHQGWSDVPVISAPTNDSSRAYRAAYSAIYAAFRTACAATLHELATTSTLQVGSDGKVTANLAPYPTNTWGHSHVAAELGLIRQDEDEDDDDDEEGDINSYGIRLPREEEGKYENRAGHVVRARIYAASRVLAGLEIAEIAPCSQDEAEGEPHTVRLKMPEDHSLQSKVREAVQIFGLTINKADQIVLEINRKAPLTLPHQRELHRAVLEARVCEGATLLLQKIQRDSFNPMADTTLLGTEDAVNCFALLSGLLVVGPTDKVLAAMNSIVEAILRILEADSRCAGFTQLRELGHTVSTFTSDDVTANGNLAKQYILTPGGKELKDLTEASKKSVHNIILGLREWCRGFQRFYQGRSRAYVSHLQNLCIAGEGMYSGPLMFAAANIVMAAKQRSGLTLRQQILAGLTRSEGSTYFGGFKEVIEAGNLRAPGMLQTTLHMNGLAYSHLLASVAGIASNVVRASVDELVSAVEEARGMFKTKDLTSSIDLANLDWVTVSKKPEAQFTAKQNIAWRLLAEAADLRPHGFKAKDEATKPTAGSDSLVIHRSWFNDTVIGRELAAAAAPDAACRPECKARSRGTTVLPPESTSASAQPRGRSQRPKTYRPKDFTITEGGAINLSSRFLNAHRDIAGRLEALGYTFRAGESVSIPAPTLLSERGFGDHGLAAVFEEVVAGSRRIPRAVKKLAARADPMLFLARGEEDTAPFPVYGLIKTEVSGNFRGVGDADANLYDHCLLPADPGSRTVNHRLVGPGSLLDLAIQRHNARRRRRS